MLKKIIAAILVAHAVWWMNLRIPKLQVVEDFVNFFSTKIFFYYFAFQYSYRGRSNSKTLIIGSIKLLLCFIFYYLLEDGHFSKVANFRLEMLFDVTSMQLSHNFASFAESELIPVVLAIAM
jgi:hypothetical protein